MAAKKSYSKSLTTKPSKKSISSGSKSPSLPKPTLAQLITGDLKTVEESPVVKGISKGVSVSPSSTAGKK